MARTLQQPSLAECVRTLSAQVVQGRTRVVCAARSTAGKTYDSGLFLMSFYKDMAGAILSAPAGLAWGKHGFHWKQSYDDNGQAQF